MIIRKSPDEIERMARAGRIVAETLALIGEHARPGVTTAELDELAEEFIAGQGGYPTFKGYRGYPAATCISPNAMIVHGIPGPYELGGRRHPLRRRRRHARRLRRRLRVHVPDRRDLAARPSGCSRPARPRSPPGSSSAVAGNRLSDISHAIQQATESAGFSVVRSLVGHGVGRSMHEDPQIPNYGEPGRGPLLAEGMTFAIEPMINAGGPDDRRPRRRVVDLDRGRLALGPFRAHRRGHRDRPANPDGGTRFATMTAHGAAAAVPWPIWPRPRSARARSN